MKITIEFDGQEERHEMIAAIHATDYLVALDSIEQELRKRRKYVEYEHEETRVVLDEIWDCLWEITEGLPEFDN